MYLKHLETKDILTLVLVATSLLAGLCLSIADSGARPTVIVAASMVDGMCFCFSVATEMLTVLLCNGVGISLSSLSGSPTTLSLHLLVLNWKENQQSLTQEFPLVS